CLATRPEKDRSLTPEALRARWDAEARAVGLEPEGVAAVVMGRAKQREPLGFEAVVDALVHPETGLCAHDSRFSEAHVLARVAALGAGRLTMEDIVSLSDRFLASEHVVRLVPDPAGAAGRAPEW